jgi:DNA-binding IclR family transcriptional regulator
MPRPALAATRAIAVLNYLAAHPRESFTLSDLASALDVNVASMHGLLAALSEAGYVVRHARLRTYGLGPAVAALGSAALERHTVIDVARDAARDLANELGLEVAVTAPAGDEIVILSRGGEHHARDFATYVGQRVPLRQPTGSVFVAWGRDADTWLQDAEDPDLLRAVLDGVRRRGYAVALEGPDYVLPELTADRTYDPSMIAAPVFGANGEVILSIALVGFTPGLGARDVAAYGSRLRDVAVIVTRRSGGHVPELMGAHG